MRKPIKITLIVTACITVLFLVLFTAWQVFFRQAHPRTRGTVKIEGVMAPVEIYRDRNGIPHIYAQNAEDLFFGQGYLHAQDRFWQMEYWRRIGSGRLSELFGKTTRESDIYLRTLGFARIAEQEYELLDSESKKYLDAYTEGVNAYIENRKPAKLGFEFALLKLQGVKFKIEPWTPVNTLTWAKIMAWELGSNMGIETLNIDLVRRVGLTGRGDYFIPFPESQMPYIITDDELIRLAVTAGKPLPTLQTAQISQLTKFDSRFIRGFDRRLGAGEGTGLGSNSWVISGALTTTGMPILANDVHLGIQMPSIWYEVGLHCVTGEEQAEAGCRFNVRGFSFPGVPGVMIGHNDRIAWGLSNISADVQDYYIERINPENPNQYEVKGRWEDMEIIREEIKIKGEDEPFLLHVRMTRHGPIMTDHAPLRARAGFGVDPQKIFPWNLELTALSLRWTALEPISILKSVFLLNRARNFEEFHEALRYWHVPAQNVIYADIEGNIGYQTPGLMPIRLKGEGLVPAPGWTDEYEWIGFVPYDELPRVLNPGKGYIVTANNPIVSRKYPYPLATGSFASGYRAKRIIEMIEEDADGISMEDIKEMQGDVLNPSARTVIPYLKNLVFENPKLETARDNLVEWDFFMDLDSPHAPLFAYFWVELLKETFKDQYPENRWPVSSLRAQNSLNYLLEDPTNPWWDDINTPGVIERRDDILVRAFTRGYKKGVRKLGKKLEEWKWEDLHKANFHNQTLGESGIKLVESIFNRGPVAVRGGNLQVSVASWGIDKPFKVTWIASMRQIVDLSDLSKSLMMHTTGQSGHPGHSHYDDFIEPWRLLEYHPTLWNRADVEAESGRKLILAPAQ